MFKAFSKAKAAPAVTPRVTGVALDKARNKVKVTMSVTDGTGGVVTTHGWVVDGVPVWKKDEDWDRSINIVSYRLTNPYSEEERRRRLKREIDAL